MISARLLPSQKNSASCRIHLPKQRNIPNRLRPCTRFQNKRSVHCNVSGIDNELSELIMHNSYLIGKYLGYIVLFTATLNWMSYRRIRKFMEDDDNEKTKHKK
jgi:hypothetical protein